jgi:hypothetical protein
MEVGHTNARANENYALGLGINDEYLFEPTV